MAVGQILLPVLMFSPVIILPMFCIHIYSSNMPLHASHVALPT